jgi:hypothetical protein
MGHLCGRMARFRSRGRLNRRGVIGRCRKDTWSMVFAMLLCIAVACGQEPSQSSMGAAAATANSASTNGRLDRLPEVELLQECERIFTGAEEPAIDSVEDALMIRELRLRATDGIRRWLVKRSESGCVPFGLLRATRELQGAPDPFQLWCSRVRIEYCADGAHPIATIVMACRTKEEGCARVLSNDPFGPGVSLRFSVELADSTGALVKTRQLIPGYLLSGSAEYVNLRSGDRLSMDVDLAAYCMAVSRANIGHGYGSTPSYVSASALNTGRTV